MILAFLYFLTCDVACNLVIDDSITEDTSLDDCWLRVKMMSNNSDFDCACLASGEISKPPLLPKLLLAGWLAQVVERMTMDVLDVEINI